jgi:wyosine [tRNA(Phe)-imidazoG37] synthetase (radical SAM superfamily)
MQYVYPVVSRRAAGVSIGVNLNPNNACNWRCVYCQVPNLKRGGPPPLNLSLLEEELVRFLKWAVQGDFLATRVSQGARRLVDIAFSGNGEPTSAPEFSDAVACVEGVLNDSGLSDKLPMRLITNGSLLDRKSVQAGIARLGRASGEVWFKMDATTTEGLARINGTRMQPATLVRRLSLCSKLAPTWVQTCVFSFDGKLPSASEWQHYLEFLAPLADTLAGVHLYSLARPSFQREAARLGRLTGRDLELIAQQIRASGLTVKVSP